MIKLITMALAMTTATSGEMDTTIVDNPYAGTWEWEQTTIVGRGGQSVSNPITSKTTKLIVITEDFKVQVLVNDELSCEGTLEVNKLEAPNGIYADSFKSDCINGSFGISEGTLMHYEYLGCPSSTTLYTKVEK